VEARIGKAQAGVALSFADAKVISVVDGGFSAQSALLLVILLDPGVLVLNVEGGDDALGEDRVRSRRGVRRVMRRSKISWTSSGRPRSKFSRITCSNLHRAVEYLGQRKLGLQGRNIVAVANLVIGDRERMGRGATTCAANGRFFGRQAVVDLLQNLGIGATEHTHGFRWPSLGKASVERLIGDAFSLQLTLGDSWPLRGRAKMN
jgi:hypothetical protein